MKPGLSGKFEDMPVVDVLQFIYASRRSGTLHLESRGRRGFIVFRDGNISQASTNNADNNLGRILVTKGVLSEEQLAAAMAAQSIRFHGQPLGRVLSEMRLATEKEVKRAVLEQIEAAVLDFVIWTDGSFKFELGAEAEIPDDVAVPVDGILPGVNVDTQHLLLECIRIFDEKSKPAAAASAARTTAAAEITPPAEVEAPATPVHTILLYSHNKTLFAALASVADKKKVDCRVLRSFSELLFAAERLAAEDRLPVIVLDLELVFGPRGTYDAGRAAAALAKIKSLHRALEVVCVMGHADAPFRLALLEARARSVIVIPPGPALEQQPPGPEARAFIRELWAAVVECFRTYELVAVKEAWRKRISSLESYLLKLKKFVRDAQRSNFTFLASLDLLNIIAENYERAMLLLVREDVAGGIGGFGDAYDGTPLGIVAKRLSIPLREPSVFRTVFERKTTFQGKPDLGSPVHRVFYDMVGRPASGEAMVIPLLSDNKALALIYCDNGDSREPLVYDDLLDLLSNQTSILYERMLAESLPKPAGEG